jgi:hypothetical protein
VVRIKARKIIPPPPEPAPPQKRQTDSIFDAHDFMDKAMQELSKNVMVDRHEVITRLELEKQFKIHALLCVVGAAILGILAIVVFLWK